MRTPVFTGPVDDIAHALQEAPGSWFVVATKPRRYRSVLATTASRIRRDEYGGFIHTAAGKYEARVSTKGDECELYARWVPTAPATTGADAGP